MKPDALTSAEFPEAVEPLTILACRQQRDQALACRLVRRLGDLWIPLGEELLFTFQPLERVRVVLVDSATW